MRFKNFIWDKQNQSVSWTYNGNAIEERYDDMNYANYDTDDDYVIVIVGKNFRIEQVYYLSFEGKEFFAFDRANSKIKWQYNNQLIDINCPNAEVAQIYLKDDIVMAIVAMSQTDKMIKGFAMDGSLLFEAEPPIGYQFIRLSTSKNVPTVVCNGGNANADAYGRSEFHFEINTKTGALSKASLAY